MSWRDRLLPASFRGAPFRVEAHASQTPARRAVVHEYPGRDVPWAEDLGGSAGEYEVTAYVLGRDYDRDRDRLIAACAAPGAGDLDHPWLGRLRVICTGCRVSERSGEGGIARLALTFGASGESRYPARGVDTLAALDAAAVRARTALALDAARAWPAP